MADNMGDKLKQPKDCDPNKYSLNLCKNLEEDSAWNSDSERYGCKICGVRFNLYYDEMR